MVRIMTDNAANLPKHLLEQYGIGELCLTYTIDGQPADISAEFDGRSFYEAMRHGAVVQTSMVTPDAARREMEPHLKNGDDVLYIGLSSGVSGTCWGVGLVAKELAEEYPDRKIRVLNSRGASLGEGLIVLAAAKLAAEGRVIEEIEVRCEELCGKMRQHFMVDELKFLRKGGRISGGAALAGTLLQIKPILEGDEEGKIVMLSKVRGKKAGIEELVKLYDQMVEDRSAPVGISHAGSPADALVVATKLRQVGCTGEILTVCHEPVTRDLEMTVSAKNAEKRLGKFPVSFFLHHAVLFYENRGSKGARRCYLTRVSTHAEYLTRLASRSAASLPRVRM